MEFDGSAILEFFVRVWRAITEWITRVFWWNPKPKDFPATNDKKSKDNSVQVTVDSVKNDSNSECDVEDDSEEPVTPFESEDDNSFEHSEDYEVKKAELTDYNPDNGTLCENRVEKLNGDVLLSNTIVANKEQGGDMNVLEVSSKEAPAEEIVLTRKQCSEVSNSVSFVKPQSNDTDLEPEEKDNPFQSCEESEDSFKDEDVACDISSRCAPIDDKLNLKCPYTQQLLTDLKESTVQTTTARKMLVRKQSLTAIGPVLGLVGNYPGSQHQIRVLTINDGEIQESTLYRLQKGWTLQFRLGPTLLGRKVTIYVNHPENVDEDFIRNKYHPLAWKSDSGNHSDDTAIYADVSVRRAGSFHYYFTYEGSENVGYQGSGYFLVDPVLAYGTDEVLPLDCVQCQTVLAKSLGPFQTWEAKLRVTKESGYNVVHFTPVQELGASNSSYSLSDQLKLNPIFSEGKKEKITMDDVAKLIEKIKVDWKVVSICDIVLNHTANESLWLKEHPECTYNLVNTPHLRPAYLLDIMLWQFTIEVNEGKWAFSGIPKEVNSEEHLNSIRSALHGFFLPQIKIPELYMVDVVALVAEFSERSRRTVPPICAQNETSQLKILQDPQYRRLKSTVDMELALRLYNVYREDIFDEETRLKRCSEDLKHALEELNSQKFNEIQTDLSAAIENVIAGARYHRVQLDGPRIREVSKKDPLVPRYFVSFHPYTSLEEEEKQMYTDNALYIMAHNGWVMNDDPLRNFAAPGSNVYLRRELIAWGDSVKLRYGEKPEDCPYLWKRMKEYAEETARVFHGIRLDNCHSTPIHVAEYLLDAARRVRPDLYIVAELFTNSDEKDNIFVNRLGISSLIREAMSAWDSHEQGRLVYRYGAEPVGAFFQPPLRPLVPSVAHALFLDLTHDNPSPVEKRSVYDLLPSTAIVSMACCATGSNRGYDELVPHHIHVVDETRQYTEWSEKPTESPQYASLKSGIIAAKKALNRLHFELGMSGYSQVFVDQVDKDIVAITRHCPATHQSVVLVSYTAFHPPESYFHRAHVTPLRVEGTVEEVILEARLVSKLCRPGGPRYNRPQNFVKNSKYINGLDSYEVEVREHLQLYESEVVELGDSGDSVITQVDFTNLQPGTVVAVRVSLHGNVKPAVAKLRQLVSQFTLKSSPWQQSFMTLADSELECIISRLSLADLNRALYRCDEEEKDEGRGGGTYNIPSFGPMVYCGLQGFMSLLSVIRPNNDLGHPMCNNLRQGNWMIEYVSNRLKQDPGTLELGLWLDKSLQPLKDIPRYLVPSYFDAVITGVYLSLLNQTWNLMSDFVKKGSTFLKGLALGSVQCGAVIRSAPLPQLSPNMTPPLPPTRTNERGEQEQACVTLSAGLPHFSTGFMRNWGRDTFIALRGLFILTGRHQEARYHILGYAACLRHGLIPNLLDGGRNSRFNCRDAVWWWLYCIKGYVEEVHNGYLILKDKVSRIFPTDDSLPVDAGVKDQPLEDVIQEALQRHFQGMHFRERNAGPHIDEHMKDQGFNNEIGVNLDTGFVFGGNEYNCGTWMDKMGSSAKAGIKGKPATPRDGSAIELVGLSMGAVSWLKQMHKEGKYSYNKVERKEANGKVTAWSFDEWEIRIKASFEKHFWINVTPVSENEPRPDLINRRGIYKDSHGASQPWADYQLRCNFPIAMVAAPEMFDPNHAWTALKNAEEILLGPLGMKTLDPSDWAYCGYYDNSNDGSDPKVANGYNYHQGPEWLWPIGFFLRARLHFAREVGGDAELHRTAASTRAILARHFTELQSSQWRGLPELTNKDGEYCRDSCRTQAWSMGCLLEVLHAMNKIEEQQPKILDGNDN